MIDYSRIRPDIIQSLKDYIEHGIPLGHFLSAVVSNDLKEACARADESNQRCLFEIVAWLCNYAPVTCWGSESAMKSWMADKRLDREATV